MRIVRMGRPSPAMIVATLALFVALGGTAYAGLSIPANSVGSKQLRANAVTTKKIKHGAVTAAKINPKGLTVPNAASAQAIAYAHVLSNGTLDTADSKNVSSASLASGEPGIYCLKVTVPAVNATANVDIGESQTVGYASVVLSGHDPENDLGTFCPSGTNVAVITDSNGGNTDLAFYISFN